MVASRRAQRLLVQAQVARGLPAPAKPDGWSLETERFSAHLDELYATTSGWPYLVERARWGYRMGDGALYDSVLRDGLNDAFSDAHSGWHTEDLAEKYQVTREAQDTAELLRWMASDQFTFLGYRDYELLAVNGEVKAVSARWQSASEAPSYT